ncbi:double-strand break repair helicase AddA [Roseibium aestuarii]|uniref:DNA 3'-5' helicase n=1 Tax=Roseibium aestuarii TaxID=2600299 RepID=A0ABW4JYH2_9HYPH|nr:double-strand break repair helicase AddA [Roseibium aestuarii]
MSFEIPRLTRERQEKASHPEASAWVSANAGSGKTFVLSRRVVRLLLAGTDPSRLLCLTFTKAAAAEMATRVFRILGDWVTMEDERLADELQDIEGRRPDAARLAMARRLFARALETPGGLKIQTIHGFCEALLHQFPLEANVAGHFTVLDERIAGELMAEARAAVLQKAEADPASPYGRALATIIALMSDGGLDKGLSELISGRDALRLWLDDAGGLAPALQSLARDLDVDPEETVEDLDRRILLECPIDLNAAKAYREALALGTKTDIEKGEALVAAFAARTPDLFPALWLPVFLTKDLSPRKKLVTAKTAEAYPAMVEALAAEQQRLLDLLARRASVVTWHGTAALLTLAHAVIDLYEAAKTRQGFLDFEDLVVRTATMLSRSEAAQWVQFKLDQGLDHILVDEAQDTSPRQWQVVQALAAEFFTGTGARDTLRTIFAVGDEKQSIYSFQGAVPAYFDEMRRSFARRSEEAERLFHSVDLQLSFRSTGDVLGAVDTVFSSASAHKGLSQELKAPVHEAIRRDPGVVDLWPLEKPAIIEEPGDWREPLDRIGGDSPMVRVARRIARTIRGWMERGEADPGDVMVLLRKRGPFVEVLNRELKQMGVPAAGSDRLVLTDHIAVKDLAALGRFLLLQEDDLSLAEVLKSPLLGLTDDDLIEIARETPERPRAGTLWQSLLKKSDTSARLLEARQKLETWRARADFMPPFEFYARLLAGDGGRKAFRKRLGVEVDDVLDEFLALTMSFEQVGTPGLEGFLAWMAAAPTQIKRELSNSKGMVRIMTVHGSKGLEAKIVILVDTCAAPVHAQHDPAFLPLPRDAHGMSPPALLWLPGKSDRLPLHEEGLEALREGQREEYRRLLYVALTRAEDRLIVCGWQPARGAHEECWYSLVETALRPQAREILAPDGEVVAWRWQKTPDNPAAPDAPASADAPVAAHRAAAPSTATDAVDLPDWLRTPVTPFVRGTRLQPSKAFEAMEEKDGPEPVPALTRLATRRAGGNWPLERGRLMHKLLEVLPDLPEADRMAAAERLIARSLAEEFRDHEASLLGEIRAILDAPDLAPLFDPAGRAEVSLVGSITTARGETMAVSGQIDRLLVRDDEILIIDFKTNQVPPESPEGISLEYRAQLAVYRRLLRGIYPDRPVRAALLWTVGPSLMEVAPELLDQTLAGLRSADPVS